jgi:hypothetical protein
MYLDLVTSLTQHTNSLILFLSLILKFRDQLRIDDDDDDIKEVHY